MVMMLEQQHPHAITSNMREHLRGGKVFIDRSQNSFRKTTVCVYSLRGWPQPSASMPLHWSEVERLCRARTPKLDTPPAAVLKRLDKHGDLFALVLTLKHCFPVLREIQAVDDGPRRLAKNDG
jgi:bifunctional non-homologous end joining protein LigD